MTYTGSATEGNVPPFDGDPDVVVAAGEAVRAVLRSRLRDLEMVEDLHQEAMERVLRVRPRLDASAVVPYAVTVAKNLIIGNARRRAVADRNQHRLLDLTETEGPDEHLLREEDRVAVTAALDALSRDAREELVSHVIEGRSTIDLAEAHGGSAGGIAARLARTRARMRLDYLVAVRGVTLPTPDCHPVLLAFSAADRRRQDAVGAASHLLVCDVCSELAPPLLERRRALVGLVPIPALAPLLGTLVRLARRRTVQVGMAAGVTALAVAAVVAAQPEPAPRAASPTTTTPPTTASPPATAAPAATPSRLVVAGRPVLDLVAEDGLSEFVGQPVRSTGARVGPVSADEGFWIGNRPGRRIWVHLRTTGESPAAVREGQRVTFVGRLVAHGDDYPTTKAGLDEPSEIAELAGAGAHVEVDARDVEITGP